MANPESQKAIHASVRIGDRVIDGFMLPDGSYRMSQTQAAEVVELTERNAREFLQSKAIKTLLGEGYTPAIFEIESSIEQSRGSSRIRSLPLDVVGAYWLWQAFRGNKTALPLCLALITESLERRFDTAFGVTRSEDEYNDRLSSRIHELERDLQELGEAYALEDDAMMRLRHYEGWFRARGIDPFGGEE